MHSYVDLTVLRNVVVVALVAGTAITLLFSVAVRALVTADERPEESPAGQRLIAAGCLLVVLAAVAVGLWAVLAK
jgi:hypothetical protein